MASAQAVRKAEVGRKLGVALREFLILVLTSQVCDEVSESLSSHVI